METRPLPLDLILDRIAFCPEPLSVETQSALMAALKEERLDVAIPPEIGRLMVEIIGIPDGATLFDPHLVSGTLYLDIHHQVTLAGILGVDELGARLTRLILPGLTVRDSIVTECLAEECFDYVTGVVPVGMEFNDHGRRFDHADGTGAIRSEVAWLELAIRLVRMGGAIALLMTTEALRQMITPTIRWWLASRAREVARIYLPRPMLATDNQVCLVVFEKRSAIPSVTSLRFVLPDVTERTRALAAWKNHLTRNHEIKLREYASTVAARCSFSHPSTALSG